MRILDLFVQGIFVAGWIGFGLLVALIPFFGGWLIWDRFRHNDRDELKRLMAPMAPTATPVKAVDRG